MERRRFNLDKQMKDFTILGKKEHDIVNPFAAQQRSQPAINQVPINKKENKTEQTDCANQTPSKSLIICWAVNIKEGLQIRSNSQPLLQIT